MSKNRSKPNVADPRARARMSALWRKSGQKPGVVRQSFRCLLGELAARQLSGAALREANAHLKALFLLLNSEGEDNLNAVRHVGWGTEKQTKWPRRQALVLRRQKVAVDDILWTLEGEGVPRAVRQRYPNLSSDEFNAAIRYAMTVVSVFDCEGTRPRRREG